MDNKEVLEEFFKDFKTSREIIAKYDRLESHETTIGPIPLLPVQIEHIQGIAENMYMVTMLYVGNKKQGAKNKRKKIGPFSEKIIHMVFEPRKQKQDALLAEQKLSDFLRPFLYDEQRKDLAFAEQFRTYKKVLRRYHEMLSRETAEAVLEAKNLEEELCEAQHTLDRTIIDLVNKRRFIIAPENYNRL